MSSESAAIFLTSGVVEARLTHAGAIFSKIDAIKALIVDCGYDMQPPFADGTLLFTTEAGNRVSVSPKAIWQSLIRAPWHESKTTLRDACQFLKSIVDLCGDCHVTRLGLRCHWNVRCSNQMEARTFSQGVFRNPLANHELGFISGNGALYFRTADGGRTASVSVGPSQVSDETTGLLVDTVLMDVDTACEGEDLEITRCVEDVWTLQTDVRDACVSAWIHR